jgi:DNA-binding transcriptional LysR family regulator
MAAFVAVCEANGFAAGARRLGLSPSTVTRLIGSLESRLGVRLLQRTTRSLSLTDAGRGYLERASRILADIEEADAGVRSERAVPRGRLVVTAPRMFGRLHVAPQLSAFMARHSEVVGELRLNDRVVNLVEEGVDLAIRIGLLDDSSLVARRLGETRRVVVASPAYLERHGRPQRPEDLAAHEITLFASLDARPEWGFVARGGQELRVRLTPRFLTNSNEAAIDHVMAGGGLARVMAYQVMDSVRAGQLEVVLREHETPALPISAVYPSSRLLSAKVRAFIDLLSSEARWRFVELDQAATRAESGPIKRASKTPDSAARRPRKPRKSAQPRR